MSMYGDSAANSLGDSQGNGIERGTERIINTWWLFTIAPFRVHDTGNI
jgi:hypothetical protein